MTRKEEAEIEKANRDKSKLSHGYKRNKKLFGIIIALERGDLSLSYVAGTDNMIHGMLFDLGYDVTQGARLPSGAFFWYVRPRVKPTPKSDEKRPERGSTGSSQFR